MYKSVKPFMRRMVLPSTGTRFRTRSKLKEPVGYCVGRVGIENRKPKEIVEYIDYVPGCGGDVWWCRNTSDDTIAAYNVIDLI